MNEFEPATYWEGRLSSSFHLGGVGYIGLGQRYNGWVYRVRERIVSRVVGARFSRRDGRVLDIGSGTGFYLRLWRKLGFAHVTGSDLTTTSVAALRQELPDIAITQFDAGGQELPFERQSFDIISAMDVLPHIVDDARYRQAIVNCAALLRDGGTLLCSDYLAGEEHRAEHEVVRTKDDVVAALDAAGFELVEARPLFVVMNNPICAPPIFSKLWRLMVAPARLHERVGWLLGAVLYPLERVLTSVTRRGPSAKLLVCVLADRAQPAPGPRGSDSVS